MWAPPNLVLAVPPLRVSGANRHTHQAPVSHVHHLKGADFPPNIHTHTHTHVCRRRRHKQTSPVQIMNCPTREAQRTCGSGPANSYCVFAMPPPPDLGVGGHGVHRLARQPPPRLPPHVRTNLATQATTLLAHFQKHAAQTAHGAKGPRAARAARASATSQHVPRRRIAFPRHRAQHILQHAPAIVQAPVHIEHTKSVYSYL